MRTILITNDDGIVSDGIIRLAKTAREFGEVWVIAPMHQRSGASHSITLHDPLDVYPHDFPVEGVKAYACSGTPGDCVRVGSLSVMSTKPDVVLSGINLGYNVATDLQYSATVGAAFEAAFQGYRAIALSEHINGCHEVTDAYLKEILDEYIDFDAGYGHIVNVNFPGCTLSECGGILRNTATSHSSIYYDHYNKVCDLPGGGVRYMIEGDLNLESEPGTDFHALTDNFISVGIVNNVGVS